MELTRPLARDDAGELIDGGQASETPVTNWLVLQTLRPEYPVNFSAAPLALVGLRVKATHQLAGSLDNISAVATRLCPDFDRASGRWITRATSNPASLYRYVLQSPANPRPVADSGIDLKQLEAWHDYCRAKGLSYDRVLDEAGVTLRAVLSEIAAAGRAAPRHDGLLWGVTIDRPQDLVVDHISPRNSWGFKTSRSYVEPPHAFRVQFLDASNDFAAAERLVPWPGHTGEITLTEALELPGKTDPAEIWREARRRQYEAMHRPDTYEVIQDGPLRVATRGDLVALSHDVLDDAQVAARVLRVDGSAVTLDEQLTIVEGRSYGLRFRLFGRSDTIGTSHVRQVTAPPGVTDTLIMGGPGPMPDAGSVVLFGRASVETLPLIVTAVETTEDQACVVRLVDAAPIIDQLTDAELAPPWSSRAGTEVEATRLAPAAPRFRRIASGLTGAGLMGQVDYLIEPGRGPIPTAAFGIRHGLEGGAQTIVSIPAADGGGNLTYANGDRITLQARGQSYAGVVGPWGPVISHVVGQGDQPVPAALPSAGFRLTPGAGSLKVEFATGTDPATIGVQIYRARTADLDRARDTAGKPSPVQPGRAYAVTLTGLSAGTHYVWLEPLNASGGAGPISGPKSATVE